MNERMLRTWASATVGWFVTPVTATDDAGRSIILDLDNPLPVLDEHDEPTPFAPRTSAPSADPNATPTNRWSRAVSWMDPPLRVLVPAAGLAVVAVFCWNLGAVVARLFGVPPVAGFIALLAGAYLGRAVLARALGRPDSPRVRSILSFRLPHGQCGGCGYDLTATPRNEQGFTSCPECGAVWSVEEWREDFPRSTPVEGAREPRQHRADATILFDARGCMCLYMCRADFKRTLQLIDDRLASTPGHPVLWRRAIIVAIAALSLLGISRLCLPTLDYVVFIAAIILVPAPIPALVQARDHFRRRIVRELADEAIAQATCPCCEGPLRTRSARFDNTRPCLQCGLAWRATSTARVS